MQFWYMAYFFIQAEDSDKLNWSKVFSVFLKCQTFETRKSFESTKFAKWEGLDIAQRKANLISLHVNEIFVVFPNY